MVYKRFSTGVIVRVLLLQANLVCLAIIFARTDLFFNQLILLLVLPFQVYNLIHFVSRTNRDLTKFLLAIRQSDYSANFSNLPDTDTSFGELYQTFSDIIDSYRSMQAEKESQYQYFQLIIEQVSVGIISLDENNKIELINKAATQLLDIPDVISWAGLRAKRLAFVQAVDNLYRKGSQLAEVPMEEEVKQFSVEVIHVRLLGKPIRIITFGDIRTEIEGKEIEAWHKLIRILTHEIMNSVTPLVSLTETMLMILEEENGTQKHLSAITEDNISDIRFSLKTIQKRSGGMLHFLNDYRKLTKLPAPQLQQLQIKEIAEAVVCLMQGEASRLGIGLRVEFIQADLMITADVKLLEQVLINLLTNSLQACRGIPNPLIALHAYTKNLEVIVEVSDNGSGITKDKLDKIFIPFYSTKDEGSGIGLSVCKQIMHLHGGTIKVNSLPGVSTTFQLRFPQPQM